MNEPLEYIEYLGEVAKWYKQAPKHDYGWWVGPTVVMADTEPVGMFDYEEDNYGVYRTVPDKNVAVVISQVVARLKEELNSYEFSTPERKAVAKALRAVESVL